MLNPGDTIVLESLSGIRNKRLRKKQRAEVNSWNYLQLEQYLTYKAMAKSVHIEHVDARYTSQRCSKCGHIARSNRKTQSGFRCTKCSFTLNADLNAARNIVVKHLDSKSFFKTCEFEVVEVNQPNVRPVLEGPAKNKPLPSGRGY
jgi:IS605 OrfB family transposase